MALASVPYDFVGGTRAIADQVDANFAALVNAINTNVRISNQAATTFYVSPTGADVSGNGLSASTPAATIGYVLSQLRGNYDFNLNDVIIQLNNGTYTETVLNSGNMIGLQAATGLTIQGNMASPNLVVWNGNPCINNSNGALIAIQGVTMGSSVSQCIISNLNARVVLNGSMVFAATTGSHLFAARGGVIEARGNYTISGSASSHARAVENGQIYIDPPTGNFTDYGSTLGVPTVTLSGTPAFSNAFLVCASSIIRCAAAFTGTGATGVRSDVRMNGVINILGQGATYLPGSSAGTTATGGQIL